jgi:hypothetical protein
MKSMPGKPVFIYLTVSKNKKSASTTIWIRFNVSKSLMYSNPAILKLGLIL